MLVAEAAAAAGSSDLLGIAAIITAVGGVLAIFVQSRVTHRQVKAINKAVNQVEPGEAPLTKRVDGGFADMASRLEQLDDRLAEHTAQDGANFAQLDAGIQSLHDERRKA